MTPIIIVSLVSNHYIIPLESAGNKVSQVAPQSDIFSIENPQKIEEMLFHHGENYFIENSGQIEMKEILFYTRGYQRIAMCKNSIIITLEHIDDRSKEGRTIRNDFDSCGTREIDVSGFSFRIIFIGSNEVRPAGINPLPSGNNYFLGSDQRNWIVGVQSFQEVHYINLYNNIDLRYYWSNKSLKYDFIIHPGGNPDDIIIRYENVSYLDIEKDKTLVIGTPLGIIRDCDINTFQNINGVIVRIDGGFRLIGNSTAKFEIVEPYARNYDLVIDPRLLFGTYLGDNELDEIRDIAIDGEGNLYLTGRTWSQDFPTTTGSYQTSNMGWWDVFVTKMNKFGDRLIYSTFIGSPSLEEGVGIAVDRTGNAYVTGSTRDYRFPTTPGAFDEYHNDKWDAFVLKLDSSGSRLLYSSFIGGGWFDYASDIWVDELGNMYVCGWTLSDNFPVSSDAIISSRQGNADGYIVVLSESSLKYSTLIGGRDFDRATQIQGSDATEFYVAGDTVSFDFPITNDSMNVTQNGEKDGFIMKFVHSGSQKVEFSTFLGGSANDEVRGMAISSTGSVIITGSTSSNDFPITDSAYSLSNSGGSDVFIAGISHNGTALEFGTYLGGSDNDIGEDIVLDKSGNLYLTGFTSSKNYPFTNNSFQESFHGVIDSFVSKLSPNASRLFYSSFIGGSDEDTALEILTDINENAILCGFTNSSDFPTEIGSYDIFYGGEGDGFVCKMDIIPPWFLQDQTSTNGTTGDHFKFSIGVEDNTDVAEVLVEYQFDDDSVKTTQLGKNETYYHEIVVPDNSRTLRYRFYAYDSSRNTNSTIWTVVTVNDNDPPQMIGDYSPSNGSTGDIFPWKVEVVDNIGLESVHVEYWFCETGKRYNESMFGIRIFEYLYQLPLNSTSTMGYRILAHDFAGNLLISPTRWVQILDDDPPEIGPDKSDVFGTTGDQFQFLVEVYDNIGIQGVGVEFWIGSSSHTYLNLSFNEQYYQEIQLPLNTLSFLYYFFYAEDINGNSVKTPIRSVEIHDNDIPIFGRDLSNITATTGDPYNFIIEVDDNIKIATVEVEYWFSEGEHVKRALQYSSQYRYTMDISSNAQGTMYYFFLASDASANQVTTEIKEIFIIDNDLPIFQSDASDSIASTGDPFTFHIVVEDNIRVKELRLIYWFDEGQHRNISMENETKTIIIPEDSIAPVSYFFMAQDTSGNWNSTPLKVVDVVDNDPPQANAGIDIKITQGEELVLNGNASHDNIGIQNWTWTISGRGGFQFYDGISVSLTMDDEGEYVVNLTVRDASGLSDSDTIKVKVVAKESPPDFIIKRESLIILLSLIILVSISIFIYYRFFRESEQNE